MLLKPGAAEECIFANQNKRVRAKALFWGNQHCMIFCSFKVIHFLITAYLSRPVWLKRLLNLLRFLSIWSESSSSQIQIFPVCSHSQSWNHLSINSICFLSLAVMLWLCSSLQSSAISVSLVSIHRGFIIGPSFKSLTISHSAIVDFFLST